MVNLKKIIFTIITTFLFFSNIESKALEKDKIENEYSFLKGKIKIEVLDIAGKNIPIKSEKNSPNQFQIYIHSLPSGVYFVHLQSEGITYTSYFIKP